LRIALEDSAKGMDGGGVDARADGERVYAVTIGGGRTRILSRFWQELIRYFLYQYCATLFLGRFFQREIS